MHTIGEFNVILLGAGILAFALTLISGIRFVQRLNAKRYYSASAFAVRFVLSGYLSFVFIYVSRP